MLAHIVSFLNTLHKDLPEAVKIARNPGVAGLIALLPEGALINQGIDLLAQIEAIK